MAIQILTYSNPYQLDQESYWAELTGCPYFCASQTLVNGMKRLYKQYFQRGNITTVQRLVEAFFPDWVGTARIVKQHAVLDNIVLEDFPTSTNPALSKNMQRAFRFNREELFASIRTMAEFEMRKEEIVYERLTDEQKALVDIYDRIVSSARKRDFEFSEVFDEHVVSQKIKDAVTKANHGQTVDGLSEECIVIHGVHQFNPLILRVIDEISKYRKVVLLFNYQPQYRSAYQTWIDIYSAFDCTMQISEDREFHPTPEYATSYQGNLLADQLGKLINGEIRSVPSSSAGEIIEFDNMMEFAGYVATLFEQAGRVSPENPLGGMKEQIYAADSSVNKILRVYFPDQFGERHFLDYPLGHFFLAIANLWDPETETLTITTLNDIRECLASGILKEEFASQLLSSFCQVETLFEGCTTIKQMQDRLKRVKKNKKRISDPVGREELSHIAYYKIADKDLDMLYQAFDDLDELSSYFYEDFNHQANNFRSFYRKLKLYLQDEVMEDREIDEEFSDLIRRVLTRLEEVENIEASASFDCLKATMSIYLKQEAKPGGSANWIVRNFEQIDGDILRSLDDYNNKRDVTYHFAGLTDEELNAVNIREFPWPLNADFFEVAQNPVDWKYQVYVRSKKEYRNFKRYALLYGLEFNRCKFKLSYVKRDEEKERLPYFLLRILGYQIVPNSSRRTSGSQEKQSDIEFEANFIAQKYSHYDYFRYKICPYKFLLETLIEDTTVYKDNFLQIKYLEVLLENRIRRELQGLPVSEIVVTEKINEVYDELKRFFPFVQNASRMDSVKTIRNRLLSSKQKVFPPVTANELHYMMIRELFIHKQLADAKSYQKDVMADKFRDVSEDQISEALSEQNLNYKKYMPSTGVWCQYCSNHALCVACHGQAG